jgi:hypothetical protein
LEVLDAVIATDPVWAALLSQVSVGLVIVVIVVIARSCCEICLCSSSSTSRRTIVETPTAC